MIHLVYKGNDQVPVLIDRAVNGFAEGKLQSTERGIFREIHEHLTAYPG
jgi:hypothetical protein